MFHTVHTRIRQVGNLLGMIAATAMFMAVCMLMVLLS